MGGCRAVWTRIGRPCPFPKKSIRRPLLRPGSSTSALQRPLPDCSLLRLCPPKTIRMMTSYDAGLRGWLVWDSSSPSCSRSCACRAPHLASQFQPAGTHADRSIGRRNPAILEPAPMSLERLNAIRFARNFQCVHAHKPTPKMSPRGGLRALALFQFPDTHDLSLVRR